LSQNIESSANISPVKPLQTANIVVENIIEKEKVKLEPRPEEPTP